MSHLPPRVPLTFELSLFNVSSSPSPLGPLTLAHELPSPKAAFLPCPLAATFVPRHPPLPTCSSPPAISCRFRPSVSVFHRPIFVFLPLPLSSLHAPSFTFLSSIRVFRSPLHVPARTFMPSFSCHLLLICFPTFLASLSWLHSPAFVFRRLHRPSPSALRFSCIYSCLHSPSTTYTIRRQTPSTTFFLVASISRCPISPHFPFSFSIFHFPHPPS